MTPLARFFVRLVLCALLLVVARNASAKEEAPPPSTPTTAFTTAAGAGGYICTLGPHDGIPEEDARTAEDILCAALAGSHAPPATYVARLGKLGDKVLLVVSSRGSGEERRLLLQGLDEMPVASERIALSFARHESTDATVGPGRVVSAEATTPRTRATLPSVYLGLTGMSAAGVSASPSGGFDIAIQMQLHPITLLLEGRAGGIGSASTTLGYASISSGARYNFGDGDIAPFVGGGLGFAYFEANRANADALSGSGLEGYAEVGTSFFRSSRAGLTVSVRADLPVFSLGDDDQDGYGTSSSRYVVPLSLNLGLRFQ